MDYAIARKRLGLTQAQLAQKLGVDQSTVALWERGKTRPKVTMLPAAAAVYGVTVDELIEPESS